MALQRARMAGAHVRPVKCDLWNTTLQDICVEIDPALPRGQDVGMCFACLRPILKRGVSTRVFQGSDPCGRQILRRAPPPDSQASRHTRALQETEIASAEYFVCHICVPGIKKSIRQLEQGGDDVQLPTDFLLKSLNFMENDEVAQENKLSILKGLVCLCSTVSIGGAVRRHPLRRAEHDCTELLVHVITHVLRSEKCNFAQLREVICPLELIAFARWHVAGFPVILDHGKIWRVVRRSLATSTSTQYFDALPEARAVFDSLQRAPHCVCALCLDTKDGASVGATAFDDVLASTNACVLAPEPRGLSRRLGATVLCRFRRRPVVRSWAFYLAYASRFPRALRETSRARFYRWCLHRHHMQSAAQWVACGQAQPQAKIEDVSDEEQPRVKIEDVSDVSCAIKLEKN